MNNIIKNLIRSAAVAALITGTATFAVGTEATPGSPTTPTATTSKSVAATAENARSYPFRGTVGTTDPAARTVSLAGKNASRLVHLDGSSKLSRDGKDIALADVHTGDYLKGLILKSEGQETVIKASVGEKPEAKPRGSKAPRAKSTRTSPKASKASQASMKADTAEN